MNHILTAATQGMKAGYNQRKRTITRGGLGIQVGSFGDYCAKFGPDVTAAKASMRNKPRTTRVVGVEPFASPVAEDVFQDELETLRQRIAEIEAERLAASTIEVQVENTPKPKARKPKKAAKENLWRAWATRKYNIPTEVGAEFVYQGKRRKTTFRVTRVTSEGVYSVRAA